MAVALAIWVLCNTIKYQRHTAIVVNVIVSSSIQTLLNSIAQRFIPSVASTATEPSSVRKHFRRIKRPRDIATAVNAIGSLLIRKHLASTCGHPFMQRSSTVVIVTGTSLTSRLSISTWQTKFIKPRTKPKVSSFRLFHWVCKQCEREFRDEKGLEQHRLSVVHNPQSRQKGIRAGCVEDVQEKGLVELLGDIYIAPFSGLLRAPHGALRSLTKSEAFASSPDRPLCPYCTKQDGCFPHRSWHRSMSLFPSHLPLHDRRRPLLAALICGRVSRRSIQNMSNCLWTC